MSLLTDAMVRCVRIVSDELPDGEGGTIRTHKTADEFDAAIILESSAEIKAGGKPDAKSRYAVLVGAPIRMDYHDVFMRISDGKTFRVISDDDKRTPLCASFHVRQVTAEEFDVPGGDL